MNMIEAKDQVDNTLDIVPEKAVKMFIPIRKQTIVQRPKTPPPPLPIVKNQKLNVGTN